MSDSRPGRVLGGRYRLIRVVGQGGMGVVWAAQDQKLDRMVAVKEVIPPGQLDEQERRQAQQRVMREARAAGGVASVAAVSVYDVFAEDGHPWIVMELLEGPTLADVVRDAGRLGLADTIAIGSSLIDALEAAHRAGVLHRDVKPANVLLTRRGAVLTDFGIAHRDRDPGITTTGVVIGSASYLAPERARGGASGPAADLWALGATLYTALEGHGPFERDGQLAALDAVLNEPAPEPRHAGVLAPLLMRLLRKEPDQRPTVEETRRLLSLAGRGQAGTVPLTAGGRVGAAAVPPSSTGPPREAEERHPRAVERGTGADEPPRPPLRSRRGPGQKLVLAGLAVLLVTALLVVLAMSLPDVGSPDGEAADAGADPSSGVRNDSAGPSRDGTTSPSASPTSPSAIATNDPTADPTDDPPTGAASVPEPFKSRSLHRFARYLFDRQDCFVPSPGQYPVADTEPDTELVKCISASAPYHGTFWCKSDLDDLRADRDVYLGKAVDGTRSVTGTPAGRARSEDGIQVAFNHVKDNDARVYWDSEKRLCAGEIQSVDSDDLDQAVANWRTGRP